MVAATVLAGCGNDTEADGEGGTAAPADEQKVIEIQDQPGSVEGYAGALDDSEVSTCEPQGGSLQVAGTVTNPTPESQDYRIYVSAISNSDTVGLVQVDVQAVNAGETAEWSTTIAHGGEDLECVLRVERFPADQN